MNALGQRGGRPAVWKTVALAALAPLWAPALAQGQAAPALPSPVPALEALGHGLLKGSEGRDAVVAPVAVATVLGMVHAGANGAAERELEALFGTGRTGARQLRQGLPTLARELAPAGGPLASASRLWIDAGVAADVPAPFQRRLAARWQADAVRLPFAQEPEAARGQINRWTAERTAGKVAELLPQGSVGRDTLAVLSTAVHFRSPWAQPFDPDATSDMPFTTAAGVVRPVPTMSAEREVRQAELDGQRVLELPFAQGYALLVAVPLADAAAGPAAPRWQAWRAQLKPQRCRLTLPRFAIAPGAGSLKPALVALGVKAVFTDSADLRPMLGRAAKQAHVDDVLHAAGITVDESGGEAVAAVAATVKPKSFRAMPDCAVDRAFQFALVHQASGAPLFMGRVADPQPPR